MYNFRPSFGHYLFLTSNRGDLSLFCLFYPQDLLDYLVRRNMPHFPILSRGLRAYPRQGLAVRKPYTRKVSLARYGDKNNHFFWCRELKISPPPKANTGFLGKACR